MLMKQKRENVKDHLYVVVHPLHDKPEMKRETAHLGRMRMTPLVRRSLIALRAYLVLMLAMLAFHVLDLAGVFRR